MTNNLSTYAKDNRGRVFVLFLLFLLSLYELYTAGIASMGIVCMIPIMIVGLCLSFQYKMAVFWFIFFINYTILGIGRYYSLPVPVTTVTILPQILLSMICIYDIREKYNAKYGNLMLFALLIWIGYMFMQIFNRTCSLPISMSAWGTNFVFMGLAFLIVFYIVTTLFQKPERIMIWLRVWAYFSIVASFWAWRQHQFGWHDAEWFWLMDGGATTHLIGGSIRYFSFFSDAANFGCSIAASAIAFYILGVTTRLKRDRYLFIIAALCCTEGFFLSGTRTAMACFMVGVALYVILSKSFKIAIPVAFLGAIFFFILAFTQIGQGNMQIRRMRSVFNKNDASANVRDINKAALKKYLRDAPFGLGFNVDEGNVPANHKYKIVYQTSNDSTYVYLWQRAGIVGAILFAIVNGIILLGGSIIVFTKLHDRICIGIASSFCCAFAAIQLGGYANHILLQYPNLILYYGGMSIVYLLPGIENDFILYDNKLFKEQEERNRLKQEKKLASRV